MLACYWTNTWIFTNRLSQGQRIHITMLEAKGLAKDPLIKEYCSISQ